MSAQHRGKSPGLKHGFGWSFCRLAPKDLAEVTGLSTELQRVWRRRSLLPAASGTRAHFSAGATAEILARYELSRHGVSPSDSSEIAKQIAPSILCNALLSADGACEVVGDEAEVGLFLKAFNESDAIACQIAGLDVPSMFAWRADGGPFQLAHDREEMGKEGDYLSVFYLDLATAGQMLADRLARPLVTVEVEPAIHGRSVRRLTGRKGNR